MESTMDITFLNLCLVMIIILNLLIILVSLLQKYKELNLKTLIEMMQKFVLALSVALTIALPQAQSQSENVVIVDDGPGAGAETPTTPLRAGAGLERSVVPGGWADI